MRRVVELRRHRAHGVEQHRQRPVELLAAAGEDDVLLADLDDLGGVADAVVGGRAGRRDRIVDALDLEPGGERRRGGRRHRLRHRERADALRSLGARGVGGLDDGAGRGAARAHDDAGALVGDLASPRGRQSRSACSMATWFHAAPPPRKRIARRSTDSCGSRVGAPWTRQRNPSFGIGLGARNARFRLPQARQHFLGVVADGGDDPHPGDDDAPHSQCLPASPTLDPEPVRTPAAAPRRRGTGRP